MATLYELDGKIRAALDNATITVDPETGEIIEGSFSELEELAEERETKWECIGVYIKNLNAEADAIKAEIENLKKRLDSKTKAVDRLKGYLSESLQNAEQMKFETARVSYYFRKSKETVITDETAIPQEFMKVKTESKPDKTAIKKAIEAGTEIPGAEIVAKMSLQIK